MKLFKKSLMTLLALLFIAGCASKPVVVQEEKKPENFLWKVETENSTIHILGSVHVGNAELYPLSDTVLNAWEESDALVVEVNINDVTQEMMQQKVMEYAILTDGTTLQDYMTEEDLENLSEIFSSLGLPLENFMMMKPYMIDTLLATFSMMYTGYTAEYGIDQHFINKAIAFDIPILDLETLDDQLVALSSGSVEEQVERLLYTIEHFDELDDDTIEMVKNIRNGNVEAIEEIINESIEENPSSKEYMEIILNQRNINWMDRVTELMADDKDYFIVVGAAHLVGEGSLIDLLEEQGYNPVQQ